MERNFNVLLVIAIFCGVVLLAKRSSKLSDLRDEHARLSAKYGILDVKNPSKFLITRVETNDPMHFLWRCYYPADLRIMRRSGFGKNGNAGSSYNSVAGEYLHRVRFELGEIYMRAENQGRLGGGSQSIPKAKLSRFLKDHWSELEIEVLASDGTVEMETDEALEFLTVRIPKKLFPELKKRVGERTASKYQHAPFYQSIFGTAEALESYDQRQSELGL